LARLALRRHVHVRGDPHETGKKLVQGVRVVIRDELVLCGHDQDIPDVVVDVEARRPRRDWRGARGEDLTTGQLQQEPVPGHRVSDHHRGDRTAVPAQAVVNDVGDGRFSCGAVPGHDVQGPQAEAQAAGSTIAAVEYEFANLHRHGHTPHAWNTEA